MRQKHGRKDRHGEYDGRISIIEKQISAADLESSRLSFSENARVFIFWVCFFVKQSLSDAFDGAELHSLQAPSRHRTTRPDRVPDARNKRPADSAMRASEPPHRKSMSQSTQYKYKLLYFINKIIHRKNFTFHPGPVPALPQTGPRHGARTQHGVTPRGRNDDAALRRGSAGAR